MSDDERDTVPPRLSKPQPEPKTVDVWQDAPGWAKDLDVRFRIMMELAERELAAAHGIGKEIAMLKIRVGVVEDRVEVLEAPKVA